MTVDLKNMQQEKPYFSLAVLFQILKKNMDEEAAMAIVRAFDEFSGVHAEHSSQLATRDELKEGLSAVRSELKEGLSAVRSELKEGLSAVRSELKNTALRLQAAIDKNAQETKEDMKALRQHVDSSKWQLISTILGTGFFAIIMTILAHHFGY